MLRQHTSSSVSTRLGVHTPHLRDLPSRRARQVLRCSGVIEVDRVVVQPAYRSTPWEAEAEAAKRNSSRALVMFVSESGVCRAPLAAAAFQQLLQQSPIRDWVTVAARASRDYCLGQPPDPAAVAAGQQLGIDLAAAAAAAAADSAAAPGAAAAGGAGAVGAVQFAPAADIVAADLVLVMDKYTAADVLREVSSYDLINPGGAYSSRVRLLGSFHPRLSAAASASSQTDVADIDDPLYGNVGGDEEQEAVLAAADMIQESCSNLLRHLESLADAAGLLDQHQAAAADSAGAGDAAAAAAAAAASGGGSEAEAGHGPQQQQEEAVQKSQGELFRDAVVRHVRENGVIDWLVPPMLQGSSSDLGGWV